MQQIFHSKFTKFSYARQLIGWGKRTHTHSLFCIVNTHANYTQKVDFKFSPIYINGYTEQIQCLLSVRTEQVSYTL